MSLSSAALGLALVGSGWMMLAVQGLNHSFSPVKTRELDHTTVPILRMWQFSVPVLKSLATLVSLAVK